MGIIKIRHQGPRKDNNALHCSLTLDDVFVEEERLTPAKDHCHELDDSKLSDVGCEYALVKDQICNIPYELYELPNLKEILSLETWNSYLTEEERFHLAAYLPDMDQETFGLTMLELLGDANLFFGSPLEILFHRLKGGFYSLKVSHYREKLKFLYERRYYHSLRSYHEKMGQKIVDMRKAWSNCKPNTSVEERVQILNKKNRKPVFLVDLNSFPIDEEISSKAEKKVLGLPKVKKPRCINKQVTTDVPPVDWNAMSFNRRNKAKGVLKIKSLEMKMTSKQVGIQLHTERQEPFTRPPKGVLKLKPKGYPTSLVERPMMISVLPDQSSTVFDAQRTKLSPSSFASQWQEENLNRKLTTELTNGKQIKDALSIGSELFDNAHSFLRKKKTLNSMKMYSNDTSNFGEFFDNQQSRVLCASSLGLYQSTHDSYRRKIMPAHTDVTKLAVSRNSISVIDDYQILPNYPDHSEHRHRSKNGEGVERSRVFPITYKRKKSGTKLSAVQNLKQPSMVASMEPVASTAGDFHQMEKAKPIKIRVKGCNEFTSLKKQHILNGQYDGSSST